MAALKAKYKTHLLRAVLNEWAKLGMMVEQLLGFKPEMTRVIDYISDSTTGIETSTIQKCFWRTVMLPPREKSLLPLLAELPFDDVHLLDEDIREVQSPINAPPFGLPGNIETAVQFVYADHDEATGEAGGNDTLETEPQAPLVRDSWWPSAPPSPHPDASVRDHRGMTRLATEMLIAYSRSLQLAPWDLSILFDMRDLLVCDRLERVSSRLDIGATRADVDKQYCAHVLGASALMTGYPDASEWMMFGGSHTPWRPPPPA
ncbi:hypothetical protein CLOM_g7104 [Closterium sp. NIES-68]|nr:hypothetical protein CLOM_g7104 [Closterium sp. NIES-68]GJP72096.1 hypothetical protein CLOP_g2863 [Closterium sp. NIES-67]